MKLVITLARTTSNSALSNCKETGKCSLLLVYAYNRKKTDIGIYIDANIPCWFIRLLLGKNAMSVCHLIQDFVPESI